MCEFVKFESFYFYIVYWVYWHVIYHSIVFNYVFLSSSFWYFFWYDYFIRANGKLTITLYASYFIMIFIYILVFSHYIFHGCCCIQVWSISQMGQHRYGPYDAERVRGPLLASQRMEGSEIEIAVTEIADSSRYKRRST